MRIVAIRGRNLASLAGDFAVELDDGPLAGVGLFAITGPTGAGKSTLLDAMCLALYAEMPRLVGNGPLIGQEKEALRATDPRSVLRRGTGSGFAEVEFVGRDGRRWRSRWTVRRARDRAGERFQQAALELEDVATGERVGGTMTETLAEIRARVGLEYDEFRRSALLAQGDFAAFLKAPATERAKLLERMTGTKVYAAISMAAYARAQAEQAALDKLLEAAAGVPVRSAEARAALEDQRASAEASAASAKAAHEAAEGDVRWHAEAAQRRNEVLGAEGALRDAEDAWTAAAGQRAELADVERAEGLRATVLAADEAAARARVAEGDAVTRAGERIAAETRAGEATTLAAAAASTRARAEAAWASAEPELREARVLDERLRDARTEAARAEEGSRAATTTVGGLEAEGARLSSEADEHAARRAEAEAWLAARPEDERLAAEWTRWREALHAYVRADREVRAALSARGPLAEAAEIAEVARAKAADALEVARKGRDEETAAAAAAEAAVPSGTDLPAERARWLDARERAQSALRGLEEARRLDGERAEAERVEAEATSAREGARAARAEAERQAADARPRAEEAGRAARQAIAVQSLEVHRSQLREGEPCPLCGATEHPLFGGEAALAALRVQLEEREAALLAEVRLAEADAAAAGAREEAEARRAADAAAVREKIAGERARLPTIERTSAELEGERLAADEALARLARVEADIGVAREAARKARAAAEVAARRWEAADAALREAERAAVHADRTLRQADTQREAQVAARELAWEAVAPAFVDAAGARAELERDAVAFGKACAARVEAFSARRAEVAEAEARLAEVATRAAAAAARLEEARGKADEKAREAEARALAVTDLTAARAARLGGRPTEEVEQALKSALAAATTADASATTAARARGEEAAGARARHEESLRTLDAARGAEREEEEALAVTLSAAGLALDAVRERLAHGPAWIEARRRALAALEQRLGSTRAVLDEVRVRLDRHLAAGAPAGSPEEVAAVAAARRAEAEAAAATLVEARVALAQDDAARAKVEALLPAIEAQRETTELWQRLNALVGSKEGDKFRRYAQGLTLDALLALANAHLGDLAPRYRLMRVPGEDLDLQVVDRDLGDEPRGVQSLSGGESFLASLALALGLASLTSQDTRVDSLFVDEGFGTLDPQTLETALDALDALQATGRKVGLISHVPGMAERIGAQVRVEPLGAGRSRVVVSA